MPKLIHPNEQTVYFVTTSCIDYIPYFQESFEAELVIEQIDRLRGKDAWLVSEFVVMPDHVHLIVFPLKPLGYCMQEFKKSVARLLNWKESVSGRKIWLDEYYDRAIRDEHEYENKMEYIHLNPVKKGLSRIAEEFPFSSANPMRKTDRDKFY